MMRSFLDTLEGIQSKRAGYLARVSLSAPLPLLDPHSLSPQVTIDYINAMASGDATAIAKLPEFDRFLRLAGAADTAADT